MLSSLNCVPIPHIETPETVNTDLPAWLFENVKPTQRDEVLMPSTLDKTMRPILAPAALRGIRIQNEMLPTAISPPNDELTPLALHIIKPNLFGPNSRGEVPIYGQVNGIKISGKIDRLVVHNHKVQIVDYKTHQNPPQNGKIPQSYIRQMAGYASVKR